MERKGCIVSFFPFPKLKESLGPKVDGFDMPRISVDTCHELNMECAKDNECST